MDNPLALHPIELVLLLSSLLTLALWVRLVRGVTRRHWPVGPALVLALLALVPIVGPIAGAAVLYVTVRRGLPVRATA